MIDPLSIILGGGAAVAWAYQYFQENKEEAGQFSDLEVTMMVISSFLYVVAEADGHIHAKEEALIRDIFRETLKEHSETVDEARIKDCIEHSRNNSDMQGAVIEHAQQDADFRLSLLRFAWRVAAKDGKITDDEVAFILNAAELMNATDEELMLSTLPYLRKTNNSGMLETARQVLGVDASTSATDIKKKYRSLSNKYHPDKFVSENPVVSEMAGEKFRQITEAYELLSAGGDGHHYVLETSKSGVVLGTEKGLCRCYFCSQKCRLPLLEHIETARCAKCQALLAFDREMGQSLFENLVKGS